MANNIIPIIYGPTGSGKSLLAARLAEKTPIEIISADSRQLFKHLDIGTAKPNAEERSALPHHLIDLIEPGESYSAAQFIEDADLAIEEVHGRSVRPVVVGGTGLYLKALTEGLVQIEGDSGEIRIQLEAEAEQIGPELMHQKLAQIDPVEAERIHPHNLRRVLRALEIYLQSGKTKSELVATSAYKRSVNQFEFFCLTPEREGLYRVIEERVERMMTQGWLNEVETLARHGFAEKIRRSGVIGYVELLDYLDDQISIDEALRLIKQNTRRFAKRQMTWCRNQIGMRLFDSPDKLLAQLLLGCENGFGMVKP